MANFRSRDVAVGVGGRVAALEPYLVRPFTYIELDEEVGVYRETALRARVQLGDPAVDPFRVELGVPRGVQGVAEVHSAPVPAQLHHLRSAVQGLAGPWVRRLADDPAKVDGSRVPGVERVRDVVLAHLPRPPAGDVEEPVVE